MGSNGVLDDFEVVGKASPRLSQRLKEYRKDAKVFIERNIALSVLGIVGSLGLDAFRNLLFLFNLNPNPTPFNFGLYQGLGVAVSAAFLFMSLGDWKNYR